MLCVIMLKTKTGFKLTCDKCKKPMGTIVSKDIEKLESTGIMLRTMGVAMMCYDCSDKTYNNNEVKA
jgi:hypothetical protein